MPIDWKDVGREVQEAETNEDRIFNGVLVALILIAALAIFVVGVQLGIKEGRNLERKAQQDRNIEAVEQHYKTGK